MSLPALSFLYGVSTRTVRAHAQRRSSWKPGTSRGRERKNSVEGTSAALQTIAHLRDRRGRGGFRDRYTSLATCSSAGRSRGISRGSATASNASSRPSLPTLVGRGVCRTLLAILPTVPGDDLDVPSSRHRPGSRRLRRARRGVFGVLDGGGVSGGGEGKNGAGLRRVLAFRLGLVTGSTRRCASPDQEVGSPRRTVEPTSISLKVRSCLLREGWRSLRSALASI